MKYLPIAVGIVIIFFPQLWQTGETAQIQAVAQVQYPLETTESVKYTPEIYSVNGDRYISNPVDISGEDSCSRNGLLIINKFGTVTIEPGESWSFNTETGNPSDLPYESCYGVPAGYWCNIAAAYIKVADDMGLDYSFIDHKVGDLGQGINYSVAIWNTGNRDNPNDQDAVIINTSNRKVSFTWEGPVLIGVFHD